MRDAKTCVSGRRGKADGFSLVELMVVVLIIGVLVVVAIPVFYANIANVKKKTCFSNQRTIDGSVSTWSAANASPVAVLEGVVNASHRLIQDESLNSAPRCSAAPAPVDYLNPTPASGAYSIDASGSVVPCTFGLLEPHGSY